MIPRAHITAWRATAPWPDDAQVEQDLVLSRALVEMYGRAEVAQALAFRGGTALHKLYLDPPARYSEDIDLVQRRAASIGSVVNDLRGTLDPWLGKPAWRAGRDRFTLHYRFETSFAPRSTRRLKIEINTREHFSVHGFVGQGYAVENPWFSGAAEIVTYQPSELLGTKLRALYQRRKGRDLFDLAAGLEHPEVVVDDVVAVFDRYVARSGAAITAAQLEANVAAKMADASFRADVAPLLRADVVFDPETAWRRVREAILDRLGGEAKP